MTKKNKNLLYACGMVLGAVVLFIVGSFFDRSSSIYGMCLGLGSAVICLGVGNAVNVLFIAPKIETKEVLYRKNIEVNDERNVRIKEKVGAILNRVVIYLLSVIIIALGFMGVNVVIIIMLASIFLVELVLAIVLSNYYSKVM